MDDEDEGSSSKERWHLTQETFDKLLAHLDENRDKASEKFLAILNRLEKFFECKACPDPEDHAYEVLSRIAKKLVEGHIISDVSSYSIGVARKLLHEIYRRRDKENSLLNQLLLHLRLRQAVPEEQPDHRARHDCFDDCLGKLPDESRELIIKYYCNEKHAKIENRKQLSRELGMSPNTLRIQTHRIRAKLEKCINTCLHP